MATEVLRAVLTLADRVPRFCYVLAECSPDNMGSVSLLTKNSRMARRGAVGVDIHYCAYTDGSKGCAGR